MTNDNAASEPHSRAADSGVSSTPLDFYVGITYNLKHSAPSDAGEAPNELGAPEGSFVGSPEGPPDAEAEFDEPGTVLAIKAALETAGCRVGLFEATRELPARLCADRPDIVFNIAEGSGGRGREARVPAILNFFGIPFVGSDETTLCVAMDKALTKRLVASYRIATPKYKLFGVAEGRSLSPRGKRSRVSSVGVPYPMIVKPNAEGSSKGISSVSLVRDGAELMRAVTDLADIYGQDALAEEFIDGREFTVGILGNAGHLWAFPPMEIIFRDSGDGRNIYSFDVKRDFERHVSYKCPPDLDEDIAYELERTAEKIFGILGCRDFARVDFRLSPAGKVYFIEINPLPGLAPGYSDFPMLAEFCGMEYDALIRSVLFAALKRYDMI